MIETHEMNENLHMEDGAGPGKMAADRKKLAGAAVACLTPAASYFIFEYITGNVSTIRGVFILLNLAIFYMLYFILFAVVGSTRFSYPFLNAALTMAALAEYFVVTFRARPIMVWDVMAVKTAATVSGNYNYEMTPRLYAAISLSVLLCAAALLFPVRIRGLRARLAAVGASLASTALCLGLFYRVVVPTGIIEISMWNPAETYGEKGFLLCTARSIAYLEVKAPKGYSTQAVAGIAREIEDYKNTASLQWETDVDTVPTNLICIMNESFSDLSVIGDFQTNIPYLSYYSQLTENCVKGNLYMPIFGSMTSNAEFEFLTGDSMAFAPEGSVPYQVYMRKPLYGMPLTLKAQGYKTVAVHPYPGENWNRDEAYGAMGFDEFIDGDAFENVPLLRNYVSDKGDYDEIIRLTQEKEEGEPLFIFNVTMQNHGGYEEDYVAQVRLMDHEDMPQTEQYLSLMRESDEALRYLLEYFSAVEEPTMVVLFGDHQPSVEEEFFEALYGQALSDLKPEDYLCRYVTPFLIWTNYDMPSGQVDRMSAQYLSVAVMERANLKLTDYQYFLDMMSREAPVVHMLGYYNSDGVWESWTGWDQKKEYPIFRRFEMLQYNHLFGKKNRVDSLFSLTETEVTKEREDDTHIRNQRLRRLALPGGVR